MIPTDHSFNVAESNDFRLRPRMGDPEFQLSSTYTVESSSGWEEATSDRAVLTDYYLFMKTDSYQM